MEPNEIASVLGLATTVILSLLVILSFRKPLRDILTDLCGTEGRAQFWVIYSYLLVLCMPVIGVLIARPTRLAEKSILFMWMDQLLWCLVGLVVALFCTAFGVLVFVTSNSHTIKVSPDQADDLKRLLDRVEEIRARDIIRRSGTGASA
ncbi:MAG TPA: hypothetical protein VGP68_19105 [Gemmataceae bacterium]|jgi:hypothetical protein|nr:hypothetical protein [Gemmataceae bacterium]